MKVIDLLNKMANGEQPSHIRVYDRDWYWNNYDGYVTKSSLSNTPDAQNYLFNSYRLDFALDKEVEIIGEEKKIPEKLDEYVDVSEDLACQWTFGENNLKDKINEIIDYLDYLKSKGVEK